MGFWVKGHVNILLRQELFEICMLDRVKLYFYYFISCCFVVAAFWIVLCDLSWVIKVWTTEKHQKRDPWFGVGSIIASVELFITAILPLGTFGIFQICHKIFYMKWSLSMCLDLNFGYFSPVWFKSWDWKFIFGFENGDIDKTIFLLNEDCVMWLKAPEQIPNGPYYEICFFASYCFQSQEHTFSLNMKQLHIDYVSQNVSL